jgi:hypothetical protein
VALAQGRPEARAGRREQEVEVDRVAVACEHASLGLVDDVRAVRHPPDAGLRRQIADRQAALERGTAS